MRVVSKVSSHVASSSNLNCIIISLPSPAELNFGIRRKYAGDSDSLFGSSVVRTFVIDASLTKFAGIKRVHHGGVSTTLESSTIRLVPPSALDGSGNKPGDNRSVYIDQ